MTIAIARQRHFSVPCLLFLVVSYHLRIAAARPGTRYRAAVVEIGSFNASLQARTRKAAREVKMKNVAMIEEWIAKAARQGAQIVVFGEVKVVSGLTIPAGTAHLYAEPLPQPGPESLCHDAAAAAMPAAGALACAARRYNITVVTGLADLGPCVKNLSPFSQTAFPCDEATGLTAFNSIGVFGPDGSLLAKYHKAHLSRRFGREREPNWAEVSPPEVAIFDAPFGVRFGMFICNDINFGGPTRAILEAGVRDVLFPTLWINSGALLQAVGIQDAFSRAHGVNLLASNGNEEGLRNSGSGIWPADLSAPALQYYSNARSVPLGQGWMGVADLVSPDPADSPVPAPAKQPEDNSPWIGSVDHFSAAPGYQGHLHATAPGLECEATVDVATGGGHYALVAFAGLREEGWYTAVCAVVPCSPSSFDCDLWPSPPLPQGGAVFNDIKVTIYSRYANAFFPYAVCDGGLTVAPRSVLGFQDIGKGRRELHLVGAACPLMSAVVDAHAQWEGEYQACTYNRYPCNTTASETASAAAGRSMGKLARDFASEALMYM